ncbi:hypothetical protein LWI29_031126 [Acer saccharum]|uniref:Uncharacterized protein n=1 Tax=Acer saccharum TaxID=4024 RepID=A0AA39SZV9_ACESA|nr:hypothetical protein LWI29_031126 [Acer saccharum]
MARKEKSSFSIEKENRRSPKEGVRFRDDFPRKGHGVGEKDATRSFAEAVRGKQKVDYSVNVEEKENRKEKMKSMFWDSSQNDQEWIKKCAMLENCSVKILGGQNPCVVKVEIDPNPIDMEWLENFLVLRKLKRQKGRNSRKDPGNF